MAIGGGRAAKVITCGTRAQVHEVKEEDKWYINSLVERRNSARGTMEEHIALERVTEDSDQDRNWASAIGFEWMVI